MEIATDFRLIFVNCESLDNSQQIARILVTEKLAACCSLMPGTISIFGWQGAIHERKEVTMLIKTSNQKLEEVEKRIRELHNDEVPEIIAVNFESCDKPYLEWMKQMLPNDAG